MKIVPLVVVIAVAIQLAIAEKPPVKDEPLIGEVYLNADIVRKLAATMAAMLANIEAKKRFNVEPFSAASAKPSTNSTADCPARLRRNRSFDRGLR